MKKITLTAMSMCYLFANAQPNNPYDRTGMEFIESVKIIMSDIDHGKVKDVTQETIDYYQKQIPLTTNVDAGVAAEVIKTGQTKQFDPRVSIRNSTFSTGAKEILTTLSETLLITNDGDFTKQLIGLTNQVLKSTINSQEKEDILKLIAIEYHMGQQQYEERRGNCDLQTTDGPIKMTRKQCRKFLAFVGFMNGKDKCGIICGLGGALVSVLVGTTS